MCPYASAGDGGGGGVESFLTVSNGQISEFSSTMTKEWNILMINWVIQTVSDDKIFNGEWMEYTCGELCHFRLSDDQISKFSSTMVKEWNTLVKEWNILWWKFESF